MEFLHNPQTIKAISTAVAGLSELVSKIQLLDQMPWSQRTEKSGRNEAGSFLPAALVLSEDGVTLGKLSSSVLLGWGDCVIVLIGQAGWAHRRETVVKSVTGMSDWLLIGSDAHATWGNSYLLWTVCDWGDRRLSWGNSCSLCAKLARWTHPSY